MGLASLGFSPAAASLQLDTVRKRVGVAVSAMQRSIKAKVCGEGLWGGAEV
jgi:hypothetical protein